MYMKFPFVYITAIHWQSEYKHAPSSLCTMAKRSHRPSQMDEYDQGRRFTLSTNLWASPRVLSRVCRHWMRKFNTSFAYLFQLAFHKKSKYPECCIAYSDNTWYVGSGWQKYFPHGLSSPNEHTVLSLINTPPLINAPPNLFSNKTR